MNDQPHKGRHTRSGAEYSPFSNAVALRIPRVRLSQLLDRRAEGPDSDYESDLEDDRDDDVAAEPHDPPRTSTPPAAANPAPRKYVPGPWFRVAPPGHPPDQRFPDGGLPGPNIRCARPARKATVAEIKARRLLKKHEKDRAVRRDVREARRTSARCRLKGVTQLRVRRAVPVQLKLSLGEYAAPVASSGWQAIRQTEPDVCAYEYEELKELHPDMQAYDWDGKTPTPILDAEGYILLVLGGHPDDATWEHDVAGKAAEGITAAAIEIYTEPKWRRKALPSDDVPRRGPHAAKHVGPAMGGGQRYPQNLAHSVRNLAIFAGLFGTKALERIAGWTNMLFMAFAPDLHDFYRDNLNALCEWDLRQQRAKHITRNFVQALSVFAVATFNFGPATVTFPHIDFANLAWGWCAITALGIFDPNRGGHLILWDLKLIIRFPPGSTILLPSAILRHSNTRIRAHETRFSFTQFTPAGLFRWVYNGFHTEADADSAKSTTDAERSKRAQDREGRWRAGLKMYKRWDGPATSI